MLASERVHHRHAKRAINGALAYIQHGFATIFAQTQSGRTIPSSKRRHPTHVLASVSTPLRQPPLVLTSERTTTVMPSMPTTSLQHISILDADTLPSITSNTQCLNMKHPCLDSDSSHDNQSSLSPHSQSDIHPLTWL